MQNAFSCFLLLVSTNRHSQMNSRLCPWPATFTILLPPAPPCQFETLSTGLGEIGEGVGADGGAAERGADGVGRWWWIVSFRARKRATLSESPLLIRQIGWSYFAAMRRRRMYPPRPAMPMPTAARSCLSISTGLLGLWKIGCMSGLPATK